MSLVMFYTGHHQGSISKFVFFDENARTVNNEIIKYNVYLPIKPEHIKFLLSSLTDLNISIANLYGTKEENALRTAGKREFPEFHAELAPPIKTYPSLLKEFSMIGQYKLSAIGVDVHVVNIRTLQGKMPRKTDMCKNGDDGNIEIKYKHPTEPKEVVVNIHLSCYTNRNDPNTATWMRKRDPSFGSLKREVEKILSDAKKYLTSTSIAQLEKLDSNNYSQKSITVTLQKKSVENRFTVHKDSAPYLPSLQGIQLIVPQAILFSQKPNQSPAKPQKTLTTVPKLKQNKQGFQVTF